MNVDLALIVCFLMVSMTAVRSQIRKGPANALKKVGDCVMLECVTVNKNCDKVEWQKVEGLQLPPKLVYRNGTGMLNNDLYPPQRYSISDRRGCSLTITQLEINDSGRFICMQAVDSREETRTSILVVINVTESCESNVTSNALAKGDGYSLRCAINIPAKSVEPSNVTLSFHNKTVGETETVNENQPQTVKTTLTGIATKENITRVCRASFPPNTQANYDNTVAFMDVCTKQWSVFSVQAQIQRGPANALMKVGDIVTLECVTVNNNCDQVDWLKVEGLQSPRLVYRNGIGMLNNDIYPPQRFSVNERRGCSLTITQLEINDSGRFMCVHAADSGEETRSSILVVIDVTESCMSNVTSNGLTKDDGYSLWCAINIPPKSVEPSNVALSFHNKAVGETDTVDEKQPQTVKTKLTGIAKKENITPRLCRASFLPNKQANDDSAATLDVCTTQQLIVSYVQSGIRKGPANAVKRAGDSVTLECVTSGNNCDQVEWQKVEGMQSPKRVYRHGSGMLHNDLYPPQRYSVNENGGCSLTITRLEINDSGRFICLQQVGDKEETRISILVVISVKESCLSNVTSNALDKDDGYSLRCFINIPAKSVEPSNVTLSFHNKIVGETETTDDKQPLTVHTTLTGIATKANIMRVCRAYFAPYTQPNYDNTVAILDVCTTQPLIVSYPVENIAVSPSGPYHKGDTVRCFANGHPPPTFKWTHPKSGAVVDDATLVIKGDTGDKYTCTATNTVKGTVVSKSMTIEVSAKPNPVDNIAVSPPGPYFKGNTVRCAADGQPPPTFKWIHWKSGDVVDGDILVIKGDAGDNYTCTATNTVNGRVAFQSTTIEVSSPPPPSEPGHPKEEPVKAGDTTDESGCGPGCVAGAVCGCFMGCVVIGGVSYGVWKKKKKNDQNGEKVDMPSNDSKSSGPPTSNYTPNSEVA